jgi:hypothetical protein
MATRYWQFSPRPFRRGRRGVSVGIAYTGRWFSKERKGFAMGIFGRATPEGGHQVRRAELGGLRLARSLSAAMP